jgi:transketolase
MAASHFKMDNLVAIVDNNQIQLDGWNRDIMNIEPFSKKWEAFGWHVIEINGHDFRSILEAFDEARQTKGRPSPGPCSGGAASSSASGSIRTARQLAFTGRPDSRPAPKCG